MDTLSTNDEALVRFCNAHKENDSLSRTTNALDEHNKITDVLNNHQRNTFKYKLLTIVVQSAYAHHTSNNNSYTDFLVHDTILIVFD